MKRPELSEAAMVAGLFLSAWVLPMTTVCAQPPNQAAGPNMELLSLIRLLPGEFDNFQQVWEEQENKAERRHDHGHCILTLVSAKSLGQHVLYFRRYANGDPSQVREQSLLSFSVPSAGNAVVMEVFPFPDGTPLLDTSLEPGKLDGLIAANRPGKSGCKTYWQREEGGFRRRADDLDCRSDSSLKSLSPSAAGLSFISQDGIWLETADGGPLKMRRCRFFTGWAVIQREGTQEYDIVRDLVLHDQGARAALKSSGKEYQVELAQLVYQNTKAPVFKIAIYEQGKEQSIAYAWANPEAERIGINLRWIQAGFTLRKPAAGGSP